MKNLLKLKFVAFALLSVIALSFSACSSKTQSTQAANVTNGLLTGTWVVNDVRLEGFPSDYQVKYVFDIAPYKDFVGSTWKLYSLNGYITLTNGTTQKIVWSLIKGNANPIFQFKKVFDGEKARNVREGYQLDITSASKSNITLKSPIVLNNGSTAYVVYDLSNAK